MKKSHKILLIIAFTSILLFILTFTIGQSNNIEFRDSHLQKRYYIFLLIIAPVSLLSILSILNQYLKSTDNKILNLMLFLVLTYFSFTTCAQKVFFYKTWETARKIEANDNSIIVLKQHKIGWGVKEERNIVVKPFLLIFWEVIEKNNP